MWKFPTASMIAMYDESVLKPVLSKLAKPDEFTSRLNYLNEHLDEKSADDIPLSDGSVFECCSAPVFGPDWKFYGRAWSFRDITNRKREEGGKYRESEAERFKLLQPNNLIFSKIDEAVTFGPLFNIVQKQNLNVSYLTTGQAVPEDILPADGIKFASLVYENAIPNA